METQTVTNIAFNKLVRSPKNVRVVNPDISADRQLIANIKANGVLQNLVVVPTETQGVYAFVAGGRRYSAVAHLVNQKLLPKTVHLPCLVKDEHQATELSLSENMLRQAMHPADEFVAFQAMIEGGLTQTDIAAHFGISVRQVRKRLRLAAVAPALVAYYRAGSLTLDDMMAFTVTQDHDKQLLCFEALKGRVSAWAIRRTLTDEAVRSDEAIAKFVTVNAYKRAGGAISTDLFEEITYLLNRELLTQLAEVRLEAEVGTLEGEGWKWVETRQDGPYKLSSFHRMDAKPIDVPEELEQRINAVVEKLDRLEELSADDWDDETEEVCAKLDLEYERLEAEKDRYAAFTDEQKQTAGAMVTFDESGEIRVVRGLVREADRKSAVKNDQSDRTVESSDVLSGALHRDLDAFRQQALQAALVAKPKIAADLLAFTVCSQFVEALPRWESKAVSVSCEPTRYAEDKGFEDTRAASVLQEANDKRPLEWASKDTPAARYRAFCALTPKVKALLVAYSAAQSLTASPATDRDAVSAALAEQLDLDVAGYWRPTANNYFKRLKGCDALLEIGRGWFGDVWVQKNSAEKKAVLVTRLHEAVNNTATREALDAEVLAKIDAWLPAEMRD